MIDDYVQHVFREHDQEADHWASLGAERQRKIVVEKASKYERWKAVKASWTEAPRTTEEVAVESLSKALIRQFDHSQQNCGIFGYVHGSRSDGSLCTCSQESLRSKTNQCIDTILTNPCFHICAEGTQIEVLGIEK